MVMEICVELRAVDTKNAAGRSDVIAIVDVLRCSSTVITALVNGAVEILPVRTVDEARLMKQKHPSYILAGERGGLKPKGFELGNSPREFTREKVYGKRIILTTTDGTKAFYIAQNADARALVGGFLNAEAVGLRLYEIALESNCGISLVACGKNGVFSFEDFICAGKILDTMPISDLVLSDSALAALTAFKGGSSEILDLVCSSEHGKHLNSIGLKEDIAFSLRVDLHNAVPIFEDSRITLS